MASGKFYGVCTGNAAKKYDFWVEWSSTPYPDMGYSLVSATAYLKRNDGQTSSAYNLDIRAKNKKITVGDQTATSTVVGIDTRNLKLITIATIRDVKIYHGSDGFGSVKISSSFPSVSSVNLSGGKAEKVVFLDQLDSKPPTFSQKPIAEEISRADAKITFDTSDLLSGMFYSIDGQQTWNEIHEKTFLVEGLSANTEYIVYVKLVKASNSVEAVEYVKFKTLPISVDYIEIIEPVYVGVGEKKILPYNVFPTDASIKDVEIVSSDTNILKTDGNYIIGVQMGVATISVFSKDYMKAEAQATVSVVQGLKGISISPNELQVAKGTTMRLPIVFTPANAYNKNVNLQSSDELLLTVDGDTITAVENGIVEVTATSEDGGFKARATITISGEYTWYDYPNPIEVFNTEDVEHIKSNILTIRSMLLLNGYSVGDLDEIEPRKGMQFSDILAILESIEYNIGVINSNDCESIYYQPPLVIGEYAPNKADIWRWVQVLNDIYTILKGDFPKWGVLTCSDGYLTIGGKKIVLRGDFVD